MPAPPAAPSSGCSSNSSSADHSVVAVPGSNTLCVSTPGDPVAAVQGRGEHVPFRRRGGRWQQRVHLLEPRGLGIEEASSPHAVRRVTKIAVPGNSSPRSGPH